VGKMAITKTSANFSADKILVKKLDTICKEHGIKNKSMLINYLIWKGLEVADVSKLKNTLVFSFPE
jgi:metal-responsive CopG/Arc/MetJ family transcriptional regulator